MTTQPSDDHDISLFWRVLSIFEEEGEGGFAYTVGLHDRGLPELHLDARPSLGEDPGLDWSFSTRDQCSILNELGAKLVRGTLHVGSTFSEEYDGGLARVEFRVDPPGDRDQLEALQIAPDALVLPVRWSLHRAAEGPLTELTPIATARAASAYRTLISGLDPKASRPVGWQLRVCSRPSEGSSGASDPPSSSRSGGGTRPSSSCRLPRASRTATASSPAG